MFRLAVLFITISVAACGGGSTTSEPAAAAPAPAVNPVNPDTAGNVTGMITFDGVAPKPEPIRMRSDPNCAGTAMTETVLVGDGGALQNVFVHVKDGLGHLVFPVPTTPVLLDQKGCQYVPHVFGVQVGQPVEIRNSDPTLHNVHGLGRTNREFNMGQPIQGMKTTQIFTAREVLMPFKCDVHGWMNSFVGVVDHPFYAVTAADGRFELKGLPPGTYTIEAVHEKLGAQTQSVTVGEQATADISFTFKG